MRLREHSLPSASKFHGIIVRNATTDGIDSVGGHFIYGSWYKRSELGTRAAVFCCFGHLGSMAGGWIQAGLLATLDGKSGLAAWRWLFIIVSIITLPVVIFG